MAETLQRVFCIFVRPYYYKEGKYEVIKETANYYLGKIYQTPYESFPIASTLYLFREYDKFGNEVRVLENELAQKLSPEFINQNMKFYGDTWYLHSTWISYSECRREVRKLIDIIGKENIMVTVYVPMDFEVTPDE